jgi:hypothetical protein
MNHLNIRVSSEESFEIILVILNTLTTFENQLLRLDGTLKNIMKHGESFVKTHCCTVFQTWLVVLENIWQLPCSSNHRIYIDEKQEKQY